MVTNVRVEVVTNVRVEVAEAAVVVVAGGQCLLPENAELEERPYSSCHTRLGLTEWRMLVRRYGAVYVSVAGAECIEGYE